ncbi:MAG: FAD-dependent oxidoreductase [Patescibacteria group bacterium]
MLLASGMTSNADLLRCDLAGIEVMKMAGLLRIKYMETNQPDIWALGDITRPLPAAPQGQLRGGHLAGNRLWKRAKNAQRTIPRCPGRCSPALR